MIQSKDSIGGGPVGMRRVVGAIAAVFMVAVASGGGLAASRELSVTPLDVTGVLRVSYEQVTGANGSFAVSGLYGTKETADGGFRMAGLGLEWRWYIAGIRPGPGPWGLPSWWGQDIPGTPLQGLWYAPEVRLLRADVWSVDWLGRRVESNGWFGAIGGRAGYQWPLGGGLNLQVAGGVHYLIGPLGTVSPDLWELGVGVGYAW